MAEEARPAIAAVQGVGTRRALELILTRRRLMGLEAVQWRLASRMVPTTDVLSTAIDLSKRIVRSAPPGAIAAAKKSPPTTAKQIGRPC